MTSDTLSEALIGLFRHTIPTLSWVSAERITVPLLESLVSCGFLTINKDTGVVIVHDENSTTGVLTSIAGKGCCSPKNHKDVNVLAAPHPHLLLTTKMSLAHLLHTTVTVLGATEIFHSNQFFLVSNKPLK